MVVQWESEAMNIVELREALALAHVEIGALKAESERLRLALAEEQARYPEAYIREAEAQIERLQAPPTEAEVEAAAKEMIVEMFAPHELPVDDDIWYQYVRTARAALEAAAKVRKGK